MPILTGDYGLIICQFIDSVLISVYMDFTYLGAVILTGDYGLIICQLIDSVLITVYMDRHLS